MSSRVRTPHDALLCGVFGDPQQGFAQLQAMLPVGLRELLEPGSLVPQSGTFIDGRLAARQCDLLFEALVRGAETLLYLLFEHQSSVDERMPARLLRYLVRIWECWEREHPAQVTLPPILPLVLYHGPLPSSRSASLGWPPALRRVAGHHAGAADRAGSLHP